MAFASSRWVATIASLAATVAWSLGVAHATTLPPAHDPIGVQVPHFGKFGTKVCVPRARERLKAVMNGPSAERLDEPPRGSNSPCQ